MIAFQKLTAIAAFAMLLLGGCIKDEVKRKYTFYRPQYSTKAEVRAQIASNASRPLANPGKLYYKDGFIFLSELDKGIHVIDFRNPAKPTNIAFVDIPGCVDLAVRGNTLYADMYTDLVAIDISNPQQVKLTKVVEGVFPHRLYDSFQPDTNKIITNWVRVDTTVRGDESVWGWGAKSFEVSLFASSGGDGNRAVSNGTGGSMARFALASDRLYTVSHSDIKTFNVSDPASPAYVRVTNIGSWAVETIFPFGQQLFIGSQTGMFIFNISNKDNPTLEGKFEHARVCDPVISDGRYAYVTLRDGTQCQGFINQLDVVDVKNMSAPYKVKSYPMTNPHGLSKDGNLLLICDGRAGLRIMDASNVNNVYTLATLSGLDTYDVIALGGNAIVIAKDGLYIVDYSTPTQPAIIAHLKLAAK